MPTTAAPPRVSVVICTFNRQELLSRALRAFAGLAGAEQCEIVVVDNNSADDTRETVRRCAELLAGGAFIIDGDGIAGKLRLGLADDDPTPLAILFEQAGTDFGIPRDARFDMIVNLTGKEKAIVLPDQFLFWGNVHRMNTVARIGLSTPRSP